MRARAQGQDHHLASDLELQLVLAVRLIADHLRPSPLNQETRTLRMNHGPLLAHLPASSNALEELRESRKRSVKLPEDARKNESAS